LRNPNFWRDFYGHVQKQLHRITELLTDLGLAADHPNTQFGDVVDLYTLAAEAISRTRTSVAEKTIIIENRIPQDLTKIRADRYKLSRFLNSFSKTR
jgi:hypothetical protein